MILTTLYAIGSACGFVIDLANHQWIAMICVGIMSGIAYRAGEDLYHVIADRTYNQKFGRAVIAVILIAAALYLARFPIHLVYITVPGRLWVILGVLVGAAANVDLNKKA